jgi:protein-disulfide isomerase
MNEHEGLVPTHHSAKGSALSPEIILSVSILLAAVIVGYSMISAASALENGLSGLTIQGGSLAGNNLPTAPTGNLTPPPAAAPTAQMSELVKNAAATLGKSDAPIVLVEYSDYQCPFCRKWFNDVKGNLQKDYIDTGKVLLVYKDFPLSFHPMAIPYANAARCANDQGKYWEMHDKIFLEQDKKGQGTIQDYTTTDIKKWGVEIGLNSATFDSCVDDNKYSNEIQANFSEGGSVGITGTPGFFLGKADGTGQLIVGAQPYTVFQQAIDSLQ